MPIKSKMKGKGRATAPLCDADSLLGKALKSYKSMLMDTDERASADEIDAIMQKTARLRKSYKRSRTFLFFSKPQSLLAMAATITLLLGAFSVLRPSGNSGLVIVDKLSQNDMLFTMRGDNEFMDSALILSNLQAVASQEVGIPVDTITADALAGESSVRYKLVVSYTDGQEGRVDLVLQEVATGKELDRASIPADATPDDLQGALSKMLRTVRKLRK